MTDSDIQHAVDKLAERLQRSVVINDPHVRMLYASKHFNDEDQIRVRAILQRDAGAKAIGHVLAQGVSTWSTAGIIPANEAIGMKARVCVPIRWRGEMLGQLMVMDGDESLTTSELSTINQTAQAVAASMAADWQEDSEVTVREQTFLDLIGTEPRLRRRALSELGHGPQIARFEYAIAVELGVKGRLDRIAESHVSSALRSAVMMDYRQGQASVAFAIASNSGTLLLGSAYALEEAAVKIHVQKMLDRLADLASGRFECVAGIGSSVAGLEQAHKTVRQAHLARRAAVQVHGSPIASWTELGPYSLLLQIPDAEWHLDSLPDEVQRLLSADLSKDLVHTLRVYLDHACNGPAASEALHIHRTTLYYRLSRVAELAVLNLSDGVTRLSLHLGLTMLDLIDVDSELH